MTRLIVWRHGRTTWNSTDRIQGHSDIELDDTGRAQAAAAAPLLAALQPALLVASDLRRAADTAQALASVTGLAVEYDPRLRERSFGDWQGLTTAEIAARYPADYARWRRGEPLHGFDIEPLDDVRKRVTAAALDAVERAPGGTVVLTTHGGAAKNMLGGLLDWTYPMTGQLKGLDNCHWMDLRHDAIRGWVVAGYNLGQPVV